jgi:ribosome production factor 2
VPQKSLSRRRHWNRPPHARARADDDDAQRAMASTALEHKMEIKRATTTKGKRALAARAPKNIERAGKTTLVLQGATSSAVIKGVLQDIATIKHGEAHKMTRKNPGVRPFEGGGETSLEFFAKKADAGCFALGTHQKKRPHCVTIGRFFDYHLFDCVEMLVRNYKGIREFGGTGAGAVAGSKPCLLFQGDDFETHEGLKLAKNILADIFRGRVVDRINLKGVDRVITCTALTNPGGEPVVMFRQYVIKYKKSGTRLPRVELAEMGPSFDFSCGRVRQAPPDVKREAYARSRVAKKQKNVTHDALEGKVGRLYVEKQTGFESLGAAKMKGMKRERRAAAAEKQAEKQEEKTAMAEGESGGRPKRSKA